MHYLSRTITHLTLSSNCALVSYNNYSIIVKRNEPFSWVDELITPCFSSLFFLSLFTFSISSSSSSASNMAALALWLAAERKPAAVTVAVARMALLVVTMVGAADLHTICSGCVWNVEGEDEEDVDGRNTFAFESKNVAILIWCVFFGGKANKGKKLCTR